MAPFHSGKNRKQLERLTGYFHQAVVSFVATGQEDQAVSGYFKNRNSGDMVKIIISDPPIFLDKTEDGGSDLGQKSILARFSFPKNYPPCLSFLTHRYTGVYFLKTKILKLKWGKIRLGGWEKISDLAGSWNSETFEKKVECRISPPGFSLFRSGGSGRSGGE